MTVDFHTSEHVARLVRSFHRFVDEAGPVVVVQNGDRTANGALRALGADIVGLGINVGHGLGLDLGLRRVETEFCLIADPDSVIVSDAFADEMLPRAREHGVASLDRHYHHPICLLFRTALWKTNAVSFEEDYDHDLDVAERFSHILGPVTEATALRLTHLAPTPDSPDWNGACYGQVWSGVFSNTYGAARSRTPGTTSVDGHSVDALRDYHRRWASWAEDVLDGRATVDDFPV